MIRWDFVSNSSSTCSMFPNITKIDTSDIEYTGRLKHQPFYEPLLFNYFITRNSNRKYEVYFRQKPSNNGMEFFPRYIEQMDCEYDSLKDALKDYPEAVYGETQMDMIGKVFEKDPLKHLKIENVESTYTNGNDKSVRIENELGYVCIDSEPIRKLIGDEEYSKINIPDNENLDYEQGNVNPTWNTEKGETK